jgi:hypothetical protein
MLTQAEDILRNNTLRGSEEGREHDLEALMKKAEVDAGGRFASAIA